MNTDGPISGMTPEVIEPKPQAFFADNFRSVQSFLKTMSPDQNLITRAKGFDPRMSDAFNKLARIKDLSSTQAGKLVNEVSQTAFEPHGFRLVYNHPAKDLQAELGLAGILGKHPLIYTQRLLDGNSRTLRIYLLHSYLYNRDINTYASIADGYAHVYEESINDHMGKIMTDFNYIKTQAYLLPWADKLLRAQFGNEIDYQDTYEKMFEWAVREEVEHLIFPPEEDLLSPVHEARASLARIFDSRLPYVSIYNAALSVRSKLFNNESSVFNREPEGLVIVSFANKLGFQVLNKDNFDQFMDTVSHLPLDKLKQIAEEIYTQLCRVKPTHLPKINNIITDKGPFNIE